MTDKDDDEDEFFRRARDEMYPMLKQAYMSVTVLGKSDPDPKFCLELGAALLFDKPLLIVALDGVHIPDRLRNLADNVVELDADQLISEGPGAEKIRLAVEEMLGL